MFCTDRWCFVLEHIPRPAVIGGNVLLTQVLMTEHHFDSDRLDVKRCFTVREAAFLSEECAEFLVHILSDLIMGAGLYMNPPPQECVQYPHNMMSGEQWP